MCLTGLCRWCLQKSEVISGYFSLSLDDYGRVLNIVRAWITEGFVRHYRRVHASQNFGAQKKLLISYVIIRGKSNGKEEVWAGKMILLFQCLVKGATEGGELTFVRYMECVPSLDELAETLWRVCLQLSPASSAEEERDVAEEECDVAEERTNDGSAAAGEWLDVIVFQSTVSTVQVAQINILVNPFKAEQPWNSHQFYISRCFRESAMKRSRVQE